MWGALFPDMVERIAPFCGSARTSPHNFVFLEGPKNALLADAEYKDGWYGLVATSVLSRQTPPLSYTPSISHQAALSRVQNACGALAPHLDSLAAGTRKASSHSRLPLSQVVIWHHHGVCNARGV